MSETVYAVEGWFGDQEWLEGIYATLDLAEAECARLWETRASDNGPPYAKGLHKFAVEVYPVLASRDTA